MLPEGFYLGYVSAENGFGIILLVFKDNKIIGADAGGIKFDGFFENNSVSDFYKGSIKVDAPPNVQLVQGINTGPDGLTYTVPIDLPKNFLNDPYVSLKTPLGALNIKLEKIRDLGDLA